MSTPRIACVTCRELPEPDPDQPLLTAALERAGARVDVVPWDGDGYRWADADLCLPRSTWNYYEDRAAFLRWAERAATESTLVNPLGVVVANTHKRYLVELARAGVPTTPTVCLPRGAATPLARVAAEQGWRRLVIKPAVGARSWRNLRVEPETLAEGEAHLRALLAEGDALVQPYLSAVETHGERSLVWIDGALTHSIKKEPRFGDAEEQVSEQALEPPPGARALVDAALATVGEELLYARVDVVPDASGRLVIMELELVEPSLFFAQSPAALARFATAAVDRARRAS